MGRILEVDLTTRQTCVRTFPESVLREYVGGSGLGAKILYEETRSETDPLGPGNVLMFMTGPVTGTRAPTSGRHAVVAKSPLTGIWGESDIGGHWGTALKKAGFDGIIVKGAAEKPVYLWVHDGEVEIRDATHLWGVDTYDLDGSLKQETHPKAQITCIGPAGENLVKIAAVMSDGKDGRAAGRCGLGAVMGSKKLKAIVAYGNREVPVARPDQLMASVKREVPSLVENMKAMHDYGTTCSMEATEACGDLPIMNWRAGSWSEGAAKTSGQTMAKTVLTGNFYCGQCVVGCGRVVKIESGPYAPVEGSGPEYETMAALGSYCLVDDLEAICKANELCNRFGLDTISTGAAIAFAMELYEKGLISSKDAGGLQLTWGNARAVIDIIQKIARREGIGDVLAEGVKKAATAFGKNAEEYAIHVKGLELPAHDPRAFFSLAVGYATSNRGACHLQAYSDSAEKSVIQPELGWDEVWDRFQVKGKGVLTAKMQDLCAMFDSLKACKFLLWGGIKAGVLVEWLNAVTGWDMDIAEFMKTGERLYNLKRMYNVRLGLSRKDDTLPPRILTLKRGSGGAADALPPLGQMLSEYYEHRGWSEEGIPTREKLQELGLGWVL